MNDSINYRKETIQALSSQEFDLLVIGGGITGAGIARDATLRGYSVALIEKGDFGSGTSSGSSKLVHAGLRYVAQKEFGLVREASVERKKILEMAPHLTRPLKFLVPLHSDTRTTKSKIRLAVWLYDILAGFRNYTFHKILNEKKALKLLPSPIKEENFQGAALYGDGQMDDARLTLDVILSAEEHGAKVLNYCKAEVFNEGSEGNIESVGVIDALSKKAFSIKTKQIVLACGHWSDELSKKINTEAPTHIHPSKGVHLITKRFYNDDYAVVVPVNDGRIIFLVPFGNYQLVGTTDTFYEGNLDFIPVTDDDVNYLINAINYIFPGVLKKDDVVSAYSGLRPLVLSQSSKSESDVSRKHEIYEIKSNVFMIAGGKYTTYRAMSKEMVDRISKKFNTKTECITDKVPLFGWNSVSRKNWETWKTLAIEDMTLRYQLPEEVAHHLVSYGKNYKKICKLCEQKPELKNRISENRPYLMAEIDYSIQCEKVVHLQDFLLRRTQIQLSEEQGLDCHKKIANHMGKLLNWSEEEIKREIEDYESSLVWHP
ncbi:MAG: glycerol-3-phosphate dehydrogenase/oxidase [Candidatus Hodarchaeales archaeon]